LFGYLTAFYLLHLGLATSLIIAVAFTATSVGVSVKVWDDKGALKSSKGALLLDLAELDDVTAVVLMALLFAVVPSLQAGGEAPFLALLFKTSGFFILKMAGFALFCYLFARFLEKPATNFFQRYESLPDSTLTIVGIGLVIASIAEILGFSLAIGAFFAGLVFCRDPKMVSVERSFAPIYDLFSPFFFISIGYDFAPGTFTTALGLAVLLASMAIISKLLANALPIYFLSDGLTASLIGVSMVPRAEITMVIMQKGLQLGEWAVSSHVYAAMVLVSAITCFLSPVLVNSMLNKWPQDGG
jgi:Kef-type K+ transport system membrane component KefB